MRRASLVSLLLALVALVGCSTVPSSSPAVQITEAPVRPAESVGIEPLAPNPGATREEIVRGFIDASASTVRHHPVAREYLAPGPAESWSDEAGITVISSDFAIVTTETGSVEVTANVVGTVDHRGVFQVGGGELFDREFTLEEVDGEWRITNPPDGLIMLEPDFQRLYDEVDAYFLDPTGSRVVPDPRYLIGGDSQPTNLVDRLLAGPSTALAPGVRNPLSGVELASAVTVDGSTATVELTGLPDDPAPSLAELSAQLVWSLDQLADQRIRTVQILVDGEPIALDGVPATQTVEDWAAFDPDAVPVAVVGHYLDGGALHTVPDAEPAPGPAGAGEYRLTSAAASVDARTRELSFLAGVRGAPGGAELLAGPYGGQLVPVLNGTTLSAPTGAATRNEVWVVRDGREVVRVPSGGTPQVVSAPTLPGLGRATVLQLSPDGVRAAVVVDGADGRRLYVSTVVRSEDGGVALRDLRAIAPTLSQVVDVAWADAGSLLVLAGDAAQNRIVPYSLGVYGYGLTELRTSGLPSQPTSIAAAPSRQALVSAGGTIWQRIGGTWTTLVRGQEPLAGTDPFYPL